MFKTGKSYVYNGKHLIEYNKGHYVCIVPVEVIDKGKYSMTPVKVTGLTVSRVISEIDALA